MPQATETISMKTARRFILMKQGLFGDYRFIKKQGAWEYVRQAGCIQFDPVDTIGKNAELTLQSRVRNIRKKDLYDLLYKDRKLVDYIDKELSIIPSEDWPYFKRYRDLCKENGRKFEKLAEYEKYAIDYITENGPVSSSTLPIKDKMKWYSAIHWSGSWDGNLTNAARSVLEQLYTSGELVIHHKEGSRKYYDLAERHLPRELLESEDPCKNEYEHIRWRVKRRIGAVGLLWNKNSTAYLGIPSLNAETRNKVFADLLDSDEIIEIKVEGIKEPLYILAEDREILNKARDEDINSNRCEFLAPLDPMMWDRNLLEKLFDFHYRWEIYVPAAKREYGYYVLPVIHGERFVGRIDPVIRDEVMVINNIWLQPGVRKTRKLEKAVDAAMKRLARFNGVRYVKE